MESKAALASLSALAHDTRLAVFRLLVQAGPNGLAAGQIAERLSIPAPTLSFHLSHLSQAGLVSNRRIGRSLIYAAEYEAMNGLIAYLTENCCGGQIDCGPVCAPSPASNQGVPHEAPAASRRR